jgi:hypothetical protein
LQAVAVSVSLIGMLHDLPAWVGDHQRLLAALGPMAAALIARPIFGKNRALQMALYASAVWATLQVVLGPQIAEIRHHWTYLRELLQ